MQTQTDTLEGITLDWAVAQCEGVGHWDKPAKFAQLYQKPYFCRFSRDWSIGGQIIERHHLSLECIHAERWQVGFFEGETPLIAAMRCYVSGKLGNTVDIPKELLA